MRLSPANGRHETAFWYLALYARLAQHDPLIDRFEQHGCASGRATGFHWKTQQSRCRTFRIYSSSARNACARYCARGVGEGFEIFGPICFENDGPDDGMHVEKVLCIFAKGCEVDEHNDREHDEMQTSQGLRANARSL
jgi:hypothetical protein